MATRPPAQKHKITFPRRGDIFLVQFDPAMGHEIQKTRPALVIQNDISNEHSPITIVAAITSQFHDPPFPREVIIESSESGLPKRSAIVMNQIRSVDRARLVSKIGQLSEGSMQRTDEAIRISLALVEF